MKPSSEIIPTKDKREVFMRSVYDWANQSKDPRTKIGAVIVKDNVPISAGYNNFPRKVIDFKNRYEHRETKYDYIIHAEENSILNAARLGHKTDNAVLYTQGIPCKNCMKSIINAGISKIVCHKQWPNLSYSADWVKSTEIAEIMRNEAGVELEWFDKELVATGFLDGKTINV